MIPHQGGASQQAQLRTILTDVFDKAVFDKTHQGFFDETLLNELTTKVEWFYLTAGEAIVRQGEPSDAMYIILHGRARVTIQNQGENGAVVEQVIRELSSGEIVGEIGLLTDTARTATVTAMRGTTVVKLSRPVYEQLFAQYPQAMFQIARMIAGRQVGVRTMQSKRTAALTVVLMSDDPSVDLTAFTQQLSATLSPLGDVLSLNSAHFDELYGESGAAQVPFNDTRHWQINGWLAEQSTRYHFILCQADATHSIWTQRCIQQADRIFLIRQATGNPSLTLLEQTLLAGQSMVSESNRTMVSEPSRTMVSESSRIMARRELILIQPADCLRPVNTSAWLTDRPVDAHHHLRLQNNSDWQRLARRLIGRPVGLVLSGGGARGGAHVGALRALQEAKIPIDWVGGTSAGSLISASFAFNNQEFAPFFESMKWGSEKKKLYDYTLPLTSLLAGRKATAMLHRCYSTDTHIEDLWNPFFCVSANMTRAQTQLHTRGLLWYALRASTAIPGIFPPALLNGDVLVDGGIVNNFPTDLMRRFCEQGTVIGVSLGLPEVKDKGYRFGSALSGWKILGSRLNPFGKAIRAPSIYSVLMNTMDIHNAQLARANQALADLLITLNVRHIRIDDYDSFDELYQIGYRDACTALEKWDKAGIAYV